MFRNLGMPQRSGAWASAVAFAAAAALGPLPATAQTGGDGPDLLVETYRDWVVRCAPVAPAQGVAPAADAQPPARLCEIAQELGQADSGQRVLQLEFQADGDGARLTVVAPFGLRLADGVGLALSDTPPTAEGLAAATGQATPFIVIPFRTCLPQGCIAEAAMDGAMLAELGAGAGLLVILTTDDGALATLPISLAGFSGAITRLTALQDG